MHLCPLLADAPGTFSFERGAFVFVSACSIPGRQDGEPRQAQICRRESCLDYRARVAKGTELGVRAPGQPPVTAGIVLFCALAVGALPRGGDVDRFRRESLVSLHLLLSPRTMPRRGSMPISTRRGSLGCEHGRRHRLHPWTSRGRPSRRGPRCPDCRTCSKKARSSRRPTQMCMIRKTLLKLSNIYFISCLRFH